MAWLRQFLRQFLRAGILLSMLVAAYLIAALAGAMVPGPRADHSGPPEIEIRLVAGPIHYDFLLPLTDEVRARFAFADSVGVAVSHPDARWLVVGWGAREFYTSVGSYGDVGPGAIFWSVLGDTSVMRLGAAGEIGTSVGVKKLRLSREQFTALLAALEAGFQRDAAGSPILLDGTHLSPNDAFYEAKGGFHIARNCNVWVGEVLRAAGLRFGIWTPTPFAVRLSLWRFAE